MLLEAHALSAQDVCSYYGVDPSVGLSAAEVAANRKRYGRNELAPEPGTPLWKLVLKQFDDLLVRILLLAAIVDFIIALTDGDSMLGAMVEPSVIVAILVANATVGVVTERNAESAIEELKSYEAESAAVLRAGTRLLVATSDLVPGDVVELAVGTKVPADIRLVSISGCVLDVDQSLLTGESQSAEKSVAPTSTEEAVYQDMTCMLFSGTLVVAGSARGVVVATGGATAIGKIRDALTEAPEELTPLKKKLDEFGNLLAKVIAAICALVWIVNIRHFTDPELGGWVSGAIHYFKIAVALAVAAIPEGLPAVVTTCLALGTRKMAKHNAIVRSLPSVETLGCTTIICSDKTGTLTTNQMTVSKVALLESGARVEQYDCNTSNGTLLSSSGVALRRPADDSSALLQAALCVSLCNDSAIIRSADGSLSRLGEPTELALRAWVEKIGLPSTLSSTLSSYTSGTVGGCEGLPANGAWGGWFSRASLLEFTRDRRMMSVMVSPSGSCPEAARQLLPGSGSTKGMMLTKGAPESVLAACTHVAARDGGNGAPQPLTDSMRASLERCVAEMGGSAALRCLALAAKPFPAAPSGSAGEQAGLSRSDESGLTLLGIVGLHDPPRPECKAALDQCRAAGIRVIMVTGDARNTAEAVARQLGLVGYGGDGRGTNGHSVDECVEEGRHALLDTAGGVSLSGKQFASLSTSEQLEALDSLTVLSRVEPLHKLQLVELLKQQGHVVAMTGDGVNDAPALMRASIGIAMGGGTAVARHASDMVLADDNFATIVFAVAEGRAIYNNTKQFIRYMISSNIGEVVAIFAAALLGTPEVLTPVQLLWVNLVTDGLPATALGFNKPDRDIMTQPPRRMDEPIVNGWLFMRYLVIGLYVGIATAAGFLWWFLTADAGPHLTFTQLTNHQRCDAAAPLGAANSCAPFSAKEPRTVAMSVLVLIEMFNALNNLSEDASLLSVPPWDNLWLLGAIATSLLLHAAVLYIPVLATIFGVAPLGWHEWAVITYLSAPVILIDEAMKAVSRGKRRAGAKGGPNGSGGSSGIGGKGGSSGSMMVGGSGGGGSSAGFLGPGWERRVMGGQLSCSCTQEEHSEAYVPLAGVEIDHLSGLHAHPHKHTLSSSPACMRTQGSHFWR
ncbi:hypothetical protein FOA52_013016 [Chlamydomonas sp. UWO 241]|nr:hypothetical protein FOA52_013016 [Chlamydomonas sp. UWO 241]